MQGRVPAIRQVRDLRRRESGGRSNDRRLSVQQAIYDSTELVKPVNSPRVGQVLRYGCEFVHEMKNPAEAGLVSVLFVGGLIST